MNVAGSLRTREEIERRRLMLKEPHVAPLTEWVETLRLHYPAFEIPDFDPMGGGVGADILFVLEKPGPKTSRSGGGSGFISVNNDDPSAKASWKFLRDAGIQQARTCHWNIIPYWDGTLDHTTRDVREGVPYLKSIIRLLPKISVVVLVGGKAQRGEGSLAGMNFKVVTSYHPSPRVRASNPHAWKGIAAQWRKAREIADASNTAWR